MQHKSTTLSQALVCPTCLYEELELTHDARVGELLFCAHCGAIYLVHDAVPHMIDLRVLLRLPEALLAMWHLTQQRALPLYQTHSADSCALSTREDVQMFRQFAQLQNKTVLDIGSGSFELPGYAAATDWKDYVGLDPIPQSSTPDFPFLVGLAERLPFRDETFDVVLLATSLDHVLDVRSTLREAHRVLKPGGEVCFWGGLFFDRAVWGESFPSPLAPRASVSPPLTRAAAMQAYLQTSTSYEATLQRIKANEAAYEPLLIDHYHFRHLTRDVLVDFCGEVGLWPSDEVHISGSPVVETVFMRFLKRSPFVALHGLSMTLQQELHTTQQQIQAIEQQGQANQQQGHSIEQQGHELLQQGQDHHQRVHSIEQQGHELLQQVQGFQQQVQELQQQERELLHQVQVMREQGEAILSQMQENQRQVQALQQRVLAVGDQMQVLRETIPVLSPAQVQVLRDLMLAVLLILTPVRWLVRPLRWVYRSLRRIKKVLFVARLWGSAFLHRRKSTTERGKHILMLTTSQIDIDPRVNKVARTLAENGYEVDIMCYQHRAGITTVLEEVVQPGVRYIRVPREENWQDHRWLLHFWFQEEFRRAALQRTYDYVHANDLSTLLVGWLLAQSRGVPLIYDAHEMWSENLTYNGQNWVPMPSWVRMLARYYEGCLVRYVDRLITVSPSICAELQRRYKLAQAPYLLANYPELALMHGKQRVLLSIRALCNLADDHFVTLYLGGVNLVRNIENVIQAHQYLPEECVFVIRGPGVDEYGRHYQILAQTLGLEQRVFCLPPVAMDEVVGGAAGANCGIVMLRNICKNFYWFYPNKLFEYMLAGLPVAVSHFPDVTAHVEREKCGVVFDPDSPQSIAEALRWLYERPEEALAMGRRGREGVLREYNWDRASETLLHAYRTL